MKIFLIILAVIYGLTSILIYSASRSLMKACKKTNKPSSCGILDKIGVYVSLLIWAVLPILRWLLLYGAYFNYNKIQKEKEN